MSSDPSDLAPLTPGHFLIGTALNALPDVESIDDSKLSLLNRWQKVQHTVHTFWKHWSKEYLLGLQAKTKWQFPYNTASIGKLVLLVEENTAPTQWIMGRITLLHPGKDGHHRVATVHTARGDFTRALNKVCLLLIEDNN